MKLLTHNALRCPAKDVIKGYPLLIEMEEMEVVESEFNRDFMISILPSLDWAGVLIAAKVVGIDGMPQVFDTSLMTDKEFLLAMHNLLLNIHIKKGKMICPESGRSFPIENGIADMM